MSLLLCVRPCSLTYNNMSQLCQQTWSTVLTALQGYYPPELVAPFGNTSVTSYNDWIQVTNQPPVYPVRSTLLFFVVLFQGRPELQVWGDAGGRASARLFLRVDAVPPLFGVAQGGRCKFGGWTASTHFLVYTCSTGGVPSPPWSNEA